MESYSSYYKVIQVVPLKPRRYVRVLTSQKLSSFAAGKFNIPESFCQESWPTTASFHRVKKPHFLFTMSLQCVSMELP